MDQDYSEGSVSSLRSDTSALSLLAKMMRDQAALVQAMTATQGGTAPTAEDPNSELSRLNREKQELAAQVLALQQQLNMVASSGGSVASLGNRSRRSLPTGSRHSAHSSPPGRSSSHSRLGSGHSVGSGPRDPSLLPRASSNPNFHHRNGIPGVVAADVASQQYTAAGRTFAQFDDDFEGVSLGTFDDIDDRSAVSGRSGRSGRSAQSGKSSRSLKSSKSNLSKRAMKNGGFEPPLPEFVRDPNPPLSGFWRNLTFLCTVLIPDSCINRVGPSAKQAWREKVTICILALLLSAFVVGGIGFLPIYFCRASNLFTIDEIRAETASGNDWLTLYGIIYDVSSIASRHPPGPELVNRFVGQDVTAMFPRTPAARVDQVCLNLAKYDILSQLDTPTCPEFSVEQKRRGAVCHNMTHLVGRSNVDSFFRDFKEGVVVIPDWKLYTDEYTQFVLIGKSIYNLTVYTDALRHPLTQIIDRNPDHPNAYLAPPLHNFLMNKLNEDATLVFEDLSNNDPNFEIYKECLDELFFEARVDDRNDPVCRSIGVFMYFFLFLVTGMLVVQVLCSMTYLARKNRLFHDDDLQAGVMIMVPCYNEGEGELRKTIESCACTTYPFENKVMILVADGVVTGAEETRSTPEIAAEVLGFQIDSENDEIYHYQSLGKNRDNFAGVYSGTFEKKFGDEVKSLKYIAIIKRGGPEEKNSPKPGNRGKRDSQIVLAGMLNRIHHNREPCQLDMAIVKALFSLGLPAKDIEYLMAIDADTRVDTMSMNHMVYHMDHERSVLACCGETQVDNKSQSWVTMIQVFEYYSAHHMKKAFESVFGCVTCLPGCFTMYRIFTEDMKCLIANDVVLQDYSRNDIPSLHEKNLFELGEDRMLTTILLQTFPNMSLSFVPEAMCWTIVPHTMSILLSQRRRWINSTFHNMYELLKVETMCGLCFFSMKLVVVMDLVVTMILPASLSYIVYLAYLFITQPEKMDNFVLIIIGITFGLQMVPFMIRSRWDYFWWFAMFTVLGIPVFYFILPVYAFTHMDDFSWGKTRQVGGEEPKEQPKEAFKGDDKSVKSERSKKTQATASPIVPRQEPLNDKGSERGKKIGDEEQKEQPNKVFKGNYQSVKSERGKETLATAGPVAPRLEPLNDKLTASVTPVVVVHPVVLPSTQEQANESDVNSTGGRSQRSKRSAKVIRDTSVHNDSQTYESYRAYL